MFVAVRFGNPREKLLCAAAFGVLAWILHTTPDWVQFTAVILLAALVHGQVSAFEMLLLGVVLFVVLVLVPALNLGEGLRKMLLAVYVETTAFLLAFKILIRRQPQRNSMIAVAFLGALALIVVKLGVAMLSSVLNSERAVQVNIAVMRPDGTAEDPTAADRVLTLCLMLP